VPVTSKGEKIVHSQPVRVGRLNERKFVAGFRRAQAMRGDSQRQHALEIGVPRATLQEWVSRPRPAGADDDIAAFLETPAGVQLLHRLVVAAHLVFCWVGAGGIGLVSAFVAAAGLDPFVANSYGSQHGIAAEMAATLVEFGREERERLGAEMPAKEITACEDETFLEAGICLVAVEPVSGFILVEEFAERRDTETWKEALEKATEGMRVDVVQIASDDAKALIRHAGVLGAHHSPDLFHVQHEVSQAMSLPLHQRQTRAEEAVQAAEQTLAQRVRERDAYWAGPRGPGRPPNYEDRIRRAEAELAARSAIRDDAIEMWTGWRAHMRAIGGVYHPYDLESGASQPPELVATKLLAAFDGLRAIVREAGLSERSAAGIEKAARLVPKMTTTIAFYDARVRQHLDDLGLPPHQEALLRDVVIPAAYLERVAQRATGAARRLINGTAARLRASVPDLTAGELGSRLAKVAGLCADEFQRSSSCVEGRNGRLSQYQHALRQLNPAKQRALTVVHNYVSTRPDRTTAAERFFGSKPRGVMDYLLLRVSIPARPARTRTRRRNVAQVQSPK
jgi:Family of unknown function (DUF6399)